MDHKPFLMSVCGVDELPEFQSRGVTHVLSLLDPDYPDIEVFGQFGEHKRTVLRFHDLLEPEVGKDIPEIDHVAQVLALGNDFASFRTSAQDAHFLVHCRMGVSRSTAMMLTLLAQAAPKASGDELFGRLRTIRPQAWPNSRIIGFADGLLQRGGALTEALGRHYAHQIERDPTFIPMMRGYRRDAELRMGGVND